ncbi:MAG: DUF1206 domain-containing protein [Chthoniobacterales bacterium]
MARELPSWITHVARLGQAAIGLVYITVGLLAAQVAWLGHGQTGGSRAALRFIAQQPFGQVLLGVIIGGLACYVVWRLLETFTDVEGRGTDAKGLALRARSLCIAVIYGSIIAGAVKILLGSSSRGGGDGAAHDWTARILERPFGAALAAVIGAAIVAGGAYKMWSAYKRKFEKKIRLSELSANARKWLCRICLFGLTARGLVFILVGIFLIQAGLQSNPEKARGLSGALDSLQAQPYGRWLFGIVALGLAAYGIYCCVRARYGRWESR